jgi:hypothetical protein
MAISLGTSDHYPAGRVFGKGKIEKINTHASLTPAIKEYN